MSTEKSEVKIKKNYSLSFKKQYTHFFLLHDFFHKMTKTKPTNPAFMNLQRYISNGMKNAVDTGSKISVFITFASLCAYNFKGKSIKLRFIYGFLFLYWYNHIITLG